MENNNKQEEDYYPSSPIIVKKKNNGVRHLFMTIFLHNFSSSMVIPAMTDVTMSALCPGQDECSIAIYLTGFQQAMIGVGSLVMMPLIGNLSDIYGRKALLILPLLLNIFPSAVLAYDRTKYFFIAYYILNILTSMLSDGSAHCLALAYLADKVGENERASVFGVLSGVGSCAFVFGNLSTRFLSTSSTFQVAAAMAVLAALYMSIFLPESIRENTSSLHTKLIDQEEDEDEEGMGLNGKLKLLDGLPSISDMISLIKSSSAFSHAAGVTFFSSIGEVSLHSALMYYLKACFHFSKNQFAVLLVTMGIVGTASQLLLMPLVVPAVGEEKLLTVGLFFNCAHIFLYSVAWSSWVPYVAAVFSIAIVFSHPCLRSIVSKQVGANEQGKAQGCISGVNSFANVISPLVFTPLTALFLSKGAPFPFPGFSIMCIGFVLMVALLQSLLIWRAPSKSGCSTEKCSLVA